MQDCFDYQEVGEGWFSRRMSSEPFRSPLTGRANAAFPPQSVPVRRLLGPPEIAPPLNEAFTATAAEVAAACAQVEDEVDRQHGIPSQVVLAGRAIPPASFLPAMAAAVEALDRDSPVEVKPAPTFPSVRPPSTAKSACAPRSYRTTSRRAPS